jgi:hypothetical protein
MDLPSASPPEACDAAIVTSCSSTTATAVVTTNKVGSNKKAVYELTAKRMTILLRNLFATMAKVAMFQGKAMSGADQEAFMVKQFKFVVAMWVKLEGEFDFSGRRISLFKEHFKASMIDEVNCQVLYPNIPPKSVDESEMYSGKQLVAAATETVRSINNILMPAWLKECGLDGLPRSGRSFEDVLTAVRLNTYAELGGTTAAGNPNPPTGWRHTSWWAFAALGPYGAHKYGFRVDPALLPQSVKSNGPGVASSAAVAAEGKSRKAQMDEKRNVKIEEERKLKRDAAIRAQQQEQFIMSQMIDADKRKARATELEKLYNMLAGEVAAFSAMALAGSLDADDKLEFENLKIKKRNVREALYSHILNGETAVTMAPPDKSCLPTLITPKSNAVSHTAPLSSSSSSSSCSTSSTKVHELRLDSPPSDMDSAIKKKVSPSAKPGLEHARSKSVDELAKELDSSDEELNENDDVDKVEDADVVECVEHDETVGAQAISSSSSSSFPSSATTGAALLNVLANLATPTEDNLGSNTSMFTARKRQISGSNRSAYTAHGPRKRNRVSAVKAVPAHLADTFTL